MHKRVLNTRLWLTALVALVFVLGGLGGYWLSSLWPDRAEPVQDHTEVFRALVRASALPIPKAQVHCEVAGPNITMDNGAASLYTKLGDYIASYLVWSQYQTQDSSSSLSCEGNDMLKCT